jgi:formamidase
MLIHAWRSTWLRFSGVGDVPNSCATLYLPTAVFDFDVRPSARGPERAEPGSAAS